MEVPFTDSPDRQSDGLGSAQRAAIVIFARLPVPGRVKTRLAVGVGPIGACDFYRACAEHAISQAASCSDWADVFVYHSTADSTEDVTHWLRTEGLDLPCKQQLGGLITSGATAAQGDSAPGPAAPSEPDLGAKMLAAMAEAQRGVSSTEGAPGGKVLIIGTDIPDVTAQLLRRAADALDEHEMVIGPSLDGGYYMLGLTKMEPRLFQGMHWSTDSVLATTLERAAAAGLRVAPLTWLPRLRDIDIKEDLAEWFALCSSRLSAGEMSSGVSYNQGRQNSCADIILRAAAPLPELAGALQKRSEGSGLGMSRGMYGFATKDELQRRQHELLWTTERVLRQQPEVRE